jgi:hypothetical protein
MKRTQLLNDVLQGLLITSAIAVALPHVAFAQDLGAAITSTTTNLLNAPDLVNIVFYIGGAVFSGSGLLKLKAYAENPQNAPLGQGIGRISVGAALLALPVIANTLISTFSVTGGAATFTKFSSVS